MVKHDLAINHRHNAGQVRVTNIVQQGELHSLPFKRQT